MRARTRDPSHPTVENQPRSAALEARLDGLARLATRLLRAPVAVVSLAEDERLRVQGQAGLLEPWAAGRDLPPTAPFSLRALRSREVVQIDDARREPGAEKSFAVRELGAGAYLSVPVTDAAGEVLGAICVLDTSPRSWSQEEIEGLRELAEAARAEIELRRETARRVQVEEALRASEARLRAVIETEPECVKVVGADGTLLEMNSAGLGMLEADSREQVLGRSILQFVAPEHSTAVYDFHAGILGGERRTCEFEVIGLHGTRRWLESYGARLTDPRDGKVYHLGISRDVSGRKEAAEALRRSEERFRAIFDHTAVGVALISADGHILQTNHALQEILGYSDEELFHLTLAEITHPHDLPEDLRLHQEVLDGRRNSYRLQKRYLRKDGEVVWANLTASAVRDEDGRILFGVGMVEDITESRRMQAQLLQAQKMEAVGQLAGGIAHDFNNMLAVINGYAGLLLPLTQGDETLHEGLGEVLRAGERAADLTQQLLAFSRRQILAPRVIDLNEQVRATLGMLRRLIPETIEVTTHLQSGLGHVRVDPSQADQILMNLALNARDAMPQGGCLTIETRAAAIERGHPAGIEPGRYAVLCVSDTGCGMSEATLARIWEPFFTTKAVGQGTGLGLATVYGIARQSGGYAEAHSTLGRGTAVEVYLPCVDEPPSDPPPESPQAPGVVGSVLVVEDEEMVRTLVEKVLTSQGYRTRSVASGVDALRAVQSGPAAFDLLLTDLVLPGGMGGRELAEAVLRTSPRTRVLFMSGYSEDAAVGQTLGERYAGFLPKPFSPRTLTNTVAAALAAQSG
jgi:two-component system cell cycle sensor histidine kinase/response regulator CckA